MSIEALNCQCCGAPLIIFSSICECEYCGNINIIGGDAGKYINQLNRANKLRQQCEFDHAYSIYDAILAENTPSVDVLWSQALCEYGIEYVPDPVSNKYFPTLHRIKDISFLNSRCFAEALELADDEQRKQLESSAEEIARIQEEYLNIAANESPYDVFICYKETDIESGEKTEDVKLAEELYSELTENGFKVFFARETLKDKLSINYEPYIFAALKSAKAMAVLGTKAEYFTAVWVKNEWGRFLKLMDDDPEKKMFFACDDPESLPRAFASKQAQLLGETNAIKNLAKNITLFLTDSGETSKRLLTQREFDKIMSGKAKDYARSLYRTKFGEKEKNLMKEISDLHKIAEVSSNLYEYSFHAGSILLIVTAFLHIFYTVSMIHHNNESSYVWFFGIFGIILTVLLFAGMLSLFSPVFFNLLTFKKSGQAEAENFSFFFQMGMILLTVGGISYLTIFVFFPISDALIMLAIPILIFIFGYNRSNNRCFSENKRTFEKAASTQKALEQLKETAKNEFFEYDAEQLGKLEQIYADSKAQIKDYHYEEVQPAVNKQVEDDIKFLNKIDAFKLEITDLIKKRKLFTIIYGLSAVLLSSINIIIILVSQAITVFIKTFHIDICL